MDPVTQTRVGRTSSPRRRGLVLSNWEGSFATVHIVLTGGKFLTGYALALGATAFHIGVLNAIPFFFQGVQLVSAYLTNRLGRRKPLTLITSLMAREFWIVMIVLTFLPGLSATQKIYIFLAVYFLACISGILTANAWILWMGDLIPTAIRGRYLARRNLILVLVALLVDQVGSQFFEWTKQRGDPWLGHRVILSVAVVCAAVAGWFLWRQHEPKWHRTEAPPPVQFLREVWANANFKRVLKFFAVWNFGVGLSAAFFSVHMLTVLNMSYPTI
ncbi:MAG: hypothetical protein V2A74_06280, partial [bacterium]